ncbi:DNA primase [Gracilibacillus sp. Marseille-QA3620]
MKNQLIPEETVNEIRSKNDIVDVVGEYVQLKKQGRNYFGLCPFHNENSPSFSVAPDKQIFHCFGCGAGGNVFTFLMDIEGYSFAEAARSLAERVNIPLEINVNEASEGQKQKHALDDMYEAHELLRKFYHHLLVNTKQGQDALEYLLERGFTMESIEKFQLGYSLDSWDYVHNFLKKRDFSIERMEKAGLLVRRENGENYFDRFRNRIMFPIFDRQGNTIAFSGRALAAGDEPKYLNSPETPLFNKSKVVYNYHLARPFIRKKGAAILFEGFADCISADRAEVHNGIATMGTALTEQHIQLLKRSTDTIIICYDSDAPGIEAANKTADMIRDNGLHVKIALMPNGYDPDDYIKEFGEEKFQNDIIGAAHTYISFKMIYHKRGKNFANEGDKMDYIESVLQETAKLDSEVEREFYLRQIATEFTLSLESLLNQQGKVGKYNKRAPKQATQAASFQAMPAPRRKGMKPAHMKAEETLLALMLHDRELAYRIQKLLDGMEMNHDDHQAIITYLFAFYEEGHEADASLFLHFLPDVNLRKIVTEIEMMDFHHEPSEQELLDYVNQITKYKQLMVIKEKKAEQLEAEKRQDFIRAAELGKELISLRNSL